MRVHTTTGLALAAMLCAGSAAAQGERVAARTQAVEKATADTRDPRLAGLPVTSGGVPLGEEVERLARDDERFAAGLAIFDRPFHITRGLGTPELNADSCRACHQDPSIGGAGGLELNVSRFGDDGNGTIPFRNLPGGQGLSKFRPPWWGGREEYDPSTANCFEQRQTPSILGAGLIDKIPGSVIVANEDPTDADQDGIYGVARRIDINGSIEIGRFGWKAQVPRLRDFVMDAMAGELGITTPDDGRGFALVADADNVPDPELSPQQVDFVEHFMAKLPAPAFRPSDRYAVLVGEQLFGSIGCATCHVPELQGADGPVPLYSNLLLHDVMPADFRGMAEPGADTGLYRTPPLWGISMTAPYMHDGRASTLADAIAAHDGEALAVRQAFEALSIADQAAVIEFLTRL